MLFQQAASTPYPRGVPGQLRRKRIRFRRNRWGRLNPDNVYDFSCRRIDNEDHVVEHHDLIALKYRVDLHHLRRGIVKLDGVRNPRPDLDNEIHIRPVVAVDGAVAHQYAVNPGLLFARDAGEPSAFTPRAANPFTFSRAAAQFCFSAAAFLAMNAAILTLRSGAALAPAFFTALGLTCPFAIRPVFGPVPLLVLALLMILVALGGLPTLLLFLTRGASSTAILG